MKKILIITLIILQNYTGFSNCLNLENGIIYLTNSKLYFCNFEHDYTIRLGNIEDKILDFSVSPDNKYLAYSKLILKDSTIRDFQPNAIVIFDLEKMKFIDIVDIHKQCELKINFWTKSMHLICDTYGNSSDIVSEIDSWFDLRIFKDYNVIQYIAIEGNLDSLRNLNKTIIDFNNNRTLLSDCQYKLNKDQYFYMRGKDVYQHNVNKNLDLILLRFVNKAVIINGKFYGS